MTKISMKPRSTPLPLIVLWVAFTVYAIVSGDRGVYLPIGAFVFLIVVNMGTSRLGNMVDTAWLKENSILVSRNGIEHEIDFKNISKIESPRIWSKQRAYRVHLKNPNQLGQFFAFEPSWAFFLDRHLRSDLSQRIARAQQRQS